MLDLVLAVAHHLLIFALAGVLAAELVMLRPGLDADGVRRIAGIDIWYGLLAGLILAVGFSRAIFAAKGWDYYSHNLFFWGKLSALRRNRHSLDLAHHGLSALEARGQRT
jgi:putative membrane protein